MLLFVLAVNLLWFDLRLWYLQLVKGMNLAKNPKVTGSGIGICRHGEA
jgi:hypothetical protein